MPMPELFCVYTEFAMVITVPATPLQPTVIDHLSNSGVYNDKYKFGIMSLDFGYYVDDLLYRKHCWNWSSIP